MKKPVFLLLGTNLGNRIGNLAQAIRLVDQQVGKVTKVSSVYETSAWGKTDQPAFLNQAIEIRTDHGAEVVLKKVLAIEEQLGRKRREKWGERIIDIDILFFGDEVHTSDQLNIPHPQLANRKFTLIPLNEIAAELVHPTLKKKVFELLANCPDELSVHRFADASHFQ